MNGELALIATYLWAFLALGIIFLVLAPFLIWKNTANTTALVTQLLEEQERTNDLLALMLKEQGKGNAPQPASPDNDNKAPEERPAEESSEEDFKLEED